MEFNDEQLPNETSMRLMQQGYTKVKALQNKNDPQNENNNSISTDLSRAQSLIASNIDWNGNSQLLSNMCARTQNRCMKNYIRGLIELNNQDRQEINNLYQQNQFRRNPNLINTTSGNFNSAFRDYVRSETQVLDNLVDLIQSESTQNTRSTLSNIVRRRLDALDTLASFTTNNFFGF